MLCGSQTDTVPVHAIWYSWLPLQQLFQQAEHHTALDSLLHRGDQF
jgi:hypothetical protein